MSGTQFHYQGYFLALAQCHPWKHAEVHFRKKYLRLPDGTLKPLRFEISIEWEDGQIIACRSFAQAGKESQAWLCKKICQSVGKRRQAYFVRIMYDLAPKIDDLDFAD